MKLYGEQSGWYHFLNDHLGTPRKIVNASGTVVWEAGYMPFGEARVLVADVVNNLRFPGQYYDAETGFHYNWHRYYDPDTGRYLTPDPIGLEGGLNLYAYVEGNPVNWADPEGLEQKKLYPNQRYNPSNKVPKITPTNPKLTPAEPPKITPDNYRPFGMNNLPGQKIPQSPNLPKNVKAASALFEAVRNILNSLGGMYLIAIPIPETAVQNIVEGLPADTIRDECGRRVGT